MEEQEKIDAIVDAIKEAPGSTNVSAEAGRMILRAQENHVRRQDQIRSALQGLRDGAALQIGQEGASIDSDDERHAGVIVGLEIALHLFGDFPIKIRDPDEDD